MTQIIKRKFSSGWVCSMTLAGYFLGRSIPHVERYLHWIVAAVIALSILPILLEARGQFKKNG